MNSTMWEILYEVVGPRLCFEYLSCVFAVLSLFSSVYSFLCGILLACISKRPPYSLSQPLPEVFHCFRINNLPGKNQY